MTSPLDADVEARWSEWPGVVVEIHEPSGHILRESFAMGAITIGRAFDNRLILTDPHVSPYHARLLSDGQSWFLEDLESDNGSSYRAPRGAGMRRSARAREVKGRTRIDSGGTLTVGRTRLRVFSAQHPVASTRPLLRHSLTTLPQRRPALAALLAPLAMMLTAAPIYFADWHTDAAGLAMASLLLVVLFVFLWAFTFSLMGRFLRRGARFFTHAFIAVLAGVPISVSVASYQIKDFFFEPSWFWTWLLALAVGIFVFLATRASLRRASDFSLRWQLLSWAVPLVTVLTVGLGGGAGEPQRPSYPGSLLPIPTRLLEGEALDDFYQEASNRLFAP